MVLERKKVAYLGQILLKLNKITNEQLKEALVIQRSEYPDKPVGEVLIDLGYITRDELYNALALQFLYPHIEISRYKLDKEIIDLIPAEMARRYKVIPLDKFGNILTLAMFNPLDKEAIEAIGKITGLKIRGFVVDREDLQQALELVYK